MKDEENGLGNEISRLCRILNGEQESPRLPFEASPNGPIHPEEPPETLPPLSDDVEDDEEIEDEDEEEEEQEPAGTHVPADSWRMDR